MSFAKHPEHHSLPFEETLTTLKSLVPERLNKPHVGIVCGSGLHTLAAAMRDVIEVPYSALPGFGKSTGVLYFLSRRNLLSPLLVLPLDVAGDAL